MLSDHIRSGALPQGTVIREKAVGEAFGIGRMPVSHALARLEAEHLVHRRPPMHGVVVGRDPSAPLLGGGIEGARLALPGDVEAQLKIRNWRTLIYPSVERDVASCLLFGRFRIRSQALAEHFGVSRTIANELLLRLERVGVVRQESNARWYAGPLSPSTIKDLFEMRILLEPHALRQSAPSLDRRTIREKLRRVEGAGTAAARTDTSLLHRLEVDLHQDMVLQCTNAELRGTLYRCQLPLITFHLSFASYEADTDILLMIEAHRRVLESLDAGDTERAASTLAEHLRQSSDGTHLRLALLRPIDRTRLCPYLDPA